VSGAPTRVSRQVETISASRQVPRTWSNLPERGG
jgi:hypothetical protein